MRQVAITALGALVALAAATEAQPVFRQSERTGLPGSTGDYVRTIIAADVGRPGGGLPDGLADVLTLNRNQQLPVLFGRGNGRFSAGPATPVGVVPSAFALADFTGDGIPDVLVADESRGTVVFLAGSADGPPWQDPGPPIAAGTAIVAILPADVDRDRRVDAVVVDEGPSGRGVVTVLRGNGDGTFAATTSVPVGTFPAGGVVADFDSDPFPDVAVANNGDGTVTVLRNSGQGTFAVAQTRTTGVGPSSVAAGQLNGDERTDLAVSNAEGDSVAVLLGRGNALFDDAVTYPSGAEGSSPSRLALGDVNGDGHLDVLTTNRVTSDVSVLLNDGSGRLGRPRAFVADEQPEAVATGDLDGNGLADAVTVNAGPTVAALLALDDRSGTLAAVEDVFAMANPAVALSADLDSDGIADLVIGQSPGVASALQVSLAQPPRGFAAPASLDPVTGGLAGVAASDLDGDGVLDLVAVVRRGDGGVVAAYPRIGRARFAPPVTTAVGAGAAGLAVGDWNRDGRADVAVIRQVGDSAGSVDVFLATGGGIFLAGPSLPAGPLPTSVATGDLNGDGFLDLVTVNQGNATLSAWLGAGTGAFGTARNVPAGGTPRGLSVADLDQDGFDDVVLLVQTPASQVRVLFSDGRGDFVPGSARGVPAQGVGSSLAARDVTGDLVPDIIVADQVNNRAVVFVAPGNRTPFRDIQDFPVSRGPVWVTSGDLDGDGRYDGVVVNLLGASASVLANVRAAPVLRGDGNGDRRVSAADLVTVPREWADNPTGRLEVVGRGRYRPGPGVDADGDGLVTMQDAAGTAARIFAPL